MWPTLFKVLGGCLLTCAIVWGFVLAWWQSNDYAPSQTDLALYLGALPLAMVGGFLLLKGFIDNLKAEPKSAAATAAPIQDQDPLAVKQANTDAKERTYQIGLICTAALSMAGKGAQAILDAVADGVRPDPTPALSDSDGFPVFAATIEDLDTDGMREFIGQHDGELRSLIHNDAAIRHLSIVNQLLEQSIDSLPVSDAAPGQDARIRIVWLVPDQWQNIPPLEWRNWLVQRAQTYGLSSASDLAVTFVKSNVEALQQVDEIVLRANRNSNSAELTLLIAASSHIDEPTVQAWESANQLFTPKNQDRRIPGEGGVAMLLGLPASLDRAGFDNYALISRVSVGQRGKSVDSAGRVSASLLEQLVAGLLDATGIEAASIGGALADTDQRPNRLEEFLSGVQLLNESLDPVQDCLSIGTATGDMEPVAALMVLGCAQQRISETEQPLVCISNHHSLARAALMMTPSVQPTAEQSGTSI